MAPLVAVFLPLAVAYATTLGWCVDRWSAPTQYFAHCWLLPFVAAWVLWLRRAQWRERPREVDLRAAWLLLPGLLMHFAGAALMIDSWSATSLILTVPGAAWLALGRPRLQGLWPVVWLVLFAVPAPIFVEGRLAFELKEVAVSGGAAVANLFGAEVLRAGDRLTPAGADGGLFVADACGGLRSLLSMMTLAYCLAFFTGPARPLRRLALLVLAAPLALAANVLRIGALCLLARGFGVAFAEGAGHTVANVVEWLALLATLLGIDGVLSRGGDDAGDAGDAGAALSTPASTSPRGVSLRGPAVALWLAAGPLLWLSMSRPFADRADRALQLPQAVGAYRLEPRTQEAEERFQAALPRWRELLGTEDFVWRRYRDDQRHLVSLVALFHDTNWKSVHPPRICIEGSNMTILRDELIDAPWLPGGGRVSRIEAQSRADSWRYVTLSAFGTADWASGDYWEFVRRHLPRALLRANESGYLLRVESPVYRGEEAGDAAARCEEFLRELLPSAKELVR